MDENLKIMNKTEILDRSFKIFKDNIFAIVIFNIAYGIIFTVLGIIVALMGGLSLVGAASNFSGGLDAIGDSFSSMGSEIVIIIFFGFIFISLYLAKSVGIISIVSNSYLGKKGRVDEAIKVSIKSIPRLMSIIIAAAIYAIPIGIIIYIWGMFITEARIMNNIVMGEYFSTLFTFLFVLLNVVMIFLILYSYITMVRFSIQIGILEKKSFIKAVNKSFALIKGEFWKIFGMSIVVLLIGSVLEISLSAFFVQLGLLNGLITKFTMGSESLGDSLFLQGYQQVFSSIFMSIFIAPVSDIIFTLMYYNQRFKKEGYDIELRLKALQSGFKGE